VGDFRLLKLLGFGGMGAVFLAEDIRLQRPVALKLVRADVVRSRSGRERFLREARSAANIKQPVWMENYGQLDGSVFYSFNDHVKVGIQGTNLLNSRTFLDVGGAVLHPRYSWTDTDRRIAAAVRVNF